MHHDGLPTVRDAGNSRDSGRDRQPPGAATAACHRTTSAPRRACSARCCCRARWWARWPSWACARRALLQAVAPAHLRRDPRPDGQRPAGRHRHRRRRAAPQRAARRDRWVAGAARAAERDAGDLQRQPLRQDRAGHGGAAPAHQRGRRDHRDGLHRARRRHQGARRGRDQGVRGGRGPRGRLHPAAVAICCRWRWTSCRRPSSAATPSPAPPPASTTSTRSSPACSPAPSTSSAPGPRWASASPGTRPSSTPARARSAPPPRSSTSPLLQFDVPLLSLGDDACIVGRDRRPARCSTTASSRCTWWKPAPGRRIRITASPPAALSQHGAGARSSNSWSATSLPRRRNPPDLRQPSPWFPMPRSICWRCSSVMGRSGLAPARPALTTASPTCEGRRRAAAQHVRRLVFNATGRRGATTYRISPGAAGSANPVTEMLRRHRVAGDAPRS
jgi:hypothetical protein